MIRPIRIAKVIAMIVVTVAFVFPVYWMIITSLKPLDQVLAFTPRFIPIPPTLAGFIEGIKARGGFVFKNSLIIATVTTLITLVTGSLAAYSFARFKIGGFHLPFWILSTRMMPPVASIIPLFLLSLP